MPPQGFLSFFNKYVCICMFVYVCVFRALGTASSPWLHSFPLIFELPQEQPIFQSLLIATAAKFPFSCFEESTNFSSLANLLFPLDLFPPECGDHLHG